MPQKIACGDRIFFRDGGFFATTRKKIRASGGACPAGGGGAPRYLSSVDEIPEEALHRPRITDTVA